MNKKASKISNLIGELKSQHSFEPIKKGLVMKNWTTLSGPQKYLRYGAGTKDPEQALPEYAYFGDIVIMLSKLYYDNLLSVKMKSGRAVEGFRNAKVSDFFADIIMDMYANRDVSTLIKDLSLDDKNLMNSVLFQASEIAWKIYY